MESLTYQRHLSDPAVRAEIEAGVETTLRAGEMLRIDDAEGCEIRLSSGQLWITQHHDSCDYVLHAGQVFRVSRNGATLAQAMEGASLLIAYRVDTRQPSLETRPALGFASRLAAARGAR